MKAQVAATCAAVMAVAIGGCEPRPGETPADHAPREQQPVGVAETQAVMVRRFVRIVDQHRKPQNQALRNTPGSDEPSEDILCRVAEAQIRVPALGPEGVKALACLIASGADLRGRRLDAYLAACRVEDIGTGHLSPYDYHGGYAYFDKALWPNPAWRKSVWSRYVEAGPPKAHHLLGRHQAKVVLAELRPQADPR